MSRRKESIHYMLVHDFPWWVSVILSAVVYVLMKGIAPQLFQGDKLLGPMMQAMPGVAWMAAGFFLAMGALSLLRQLLEGWVNRRHEKQVYAATMTQVPHAHALPVCPDCGGEMIQRKALRGPNPGNRFWGCTAFPKCQGTRPL